MASRKSGHHLVQRTSLNTTFLSHLLVCLQTSSASRPEQEQTPALTSPPSNQHMQRETSQRSMVRHLTKQCPIYDKPHPLKKCRAFREKSYEDRKHFLNEHSICFQCCSSTSHLAKDCRVELECKECERDHHISTLHPGPAPWRPRSYPLVSEHSGECNEPDNYEITSKCTELCGGKRKSMLKDMPCQRVSQKTP